MHHRKLCFALLFAVVACQAAMAGQVGACCDGATCTNEVGSDCIGDHFVGGACTTMRACCSATDTGNVCDNRLPCDCLANGGVVGRGTCSDGCCGLGSGDVPNLPPAYNSLTDLCNSFHGFPVPPNLIPPIGAGGDPRADPPQSYIDDLVEFMLDRDYVSLGWLHDRDFRVFEAYNGTPPGGDCTRHPGMKVYYSPEVVDRLCEARCSVSTSTACFPGSCPGGESCVIVGQCSITSSTSCESNSDCPGVETCELAEPGAMFILGERPYSSINVEAGTDLTWLDNVCYDDQPSSWSVMVKGRGSGGTGTGPGWLWMENDVAGENFKFNKSSCLSCHSAAPRFETYANLGNILETQDYYEIQPAAPLSGACCDSSTGTCADQTSADCASGGGTYGGDCTDCKFIEPVCEVDDADEDGVPDASDNCPSVANSGQEDADSDGFGDVCDSCPTTFNSDQGIAFFGQTVLASIDQDVSTLEWPIPTDWELATGTFVTSTDIGNFIVDFFASGSGTGILDTGVPGPGLGYWYVFRPDCPVGSYDTNSMGQVGPRPLP